MVYHIQPSEFELQHAMSRDENTTHQISPTAERVNKAEETQLAVACAKEEMLKYYLYVLALCTTEGTLKYYGYASMHVIHYYYS